MVVVIETGLLEPFRLRLGQHAQRHAGFQPHFPHALHDLHDRGHVAVFRVAPGRAHAEALRSCIHRLGRALQQLAEEGAARVIKPNIGADWIVGVVGPLQLDVLQTRVENEYGVPIGFESIGYDTARWVASDDPRALKDFLDKNKSTMGTDRQGSPVFFANSRWALDRAAKNYPDIRFLATREMG